MYKDGNRMMAWIARIDAVQKHPGADFLDICSIGGWECVTKLGEFHIDDLVIYISIDAWVPTEVAEFLSKGKEPREFNGVKGERLRTVKLKGQISQGLILPISILKDVDSDMLVLNTDLTEVLNIQKWEKPLPTHLSGIIKGNFPSFIPKTDQERVQNMKPKLARIAGCYLNFEVTEKMDGSSMTVFKNDDKFGVCSRNLELVETEGNAFWMATRELSLEPALRSLNGNYAIQGELCGPGIQGNKYGFSNYQFLVFDIFDIDKQMYLLPSERLNLVVQLGLTSVPILELNTKFLNLDNMSEILKLAEGYSVYGDRVEREGLVFKCHNYDISMNILSFKAISNAWLLKNKE